MPRYDTQMQGDHWGFTKYGPHPHRMAKYWPILIFSAVLASFKQIFANSIDFIHEFFKFEKKLPKGLSEKLFIYFNKNSAFKKYISILADRGF